MRAHRKRPGVSETVAVLLLVAIVVGMGVLVYTFASGGLGALTQGFTGLMSGQGSAVSEDFVVEQVTFTGAGAFLAITLTNGQTTATPASFQQMVTWDPATYSAYEGTSLGNIRFCSSASCATELYSWLESCSSACSTGGSTSTSATAWVNLGSLSVPANGGTLTIYMVFEASSATFDGVYWGEAPQLSPTYAQYDNGASVFTSYFDGNTPLGDFTAYTALTVAQVTGVTGPLGAGAGCGTACDVIQVTGTTGAHKPSFAFNQAMSNTGLIAESSQTLEADTNDATGITGLLNSATTTSVTNGIAVGAGDGGHYAYWATDLAGTVGLNDLGTNGAAAGTWLYSWVTYSGPSATTFTATVAPQLYSATGGVTTGVATPVPITASTNIYLGSIGGSAAVDIYYNWMRARAYPPSGVMPSESLGSPSLNSGASLYVRNLGTTASTLVSVFVVDQSTGAVVAQVPISAPLTSGALVDVSYTAYSGLAFLPTPGQTYSFTVTSSLGNSVKYNTEAL